MNAVSTRSARGIASLTGSLLLLCGTVAWPLIASAHDDAEENAALSTVKVNLSEWRVQLNPPSIPPGLVVLEVTNAGSIPHAFEVEGRGLEKSTTQIQPGATATLKLELSAGRYEVYCPVGKGSHKMLGMTNHLTVGNPKRATAANETHEEMDMHAASGNAGGEHDEQGGNDSAAAKSMKLAGGGPVIQILPGPYPFADSAMAIIASRPPDQKEDLTHKAHMGPYSNNVAKISGDISVMAVDRGASGDSVSGVASFTSQDGSRWKVVMDRVQTKDIPFNPRFGGVIMGLFYHGASGVHTPLVPTIQSSLALWAFAHLYKNDQLVTDNAMVHIMLLSRTRRTSDWALDCWDCSDRPIEELQLQVTAAPGTPPFDAPGGFLFVNWEKSSGQRVSL
jgi:hypothetical protein